MTRRCVARCDEIRCDATYDMRCDVMCQRCDAESELLGSFHFDGAHTAGDGSCDVTSHSMDAGFCNLESQKWLTREPLVPPPLGEQRTQLGMFRDTPRS